MKKEISSDAMETDDWEDDSYQVPVPSEVNEYHILVIDEDKTFARRIASILQEATYQVTEIHNPEVALTRIQEQPKLFDLVLLGTPLQDSDCLSFLDKILAANEDMPVIFMTSKPNMMDALTALQSGATLVLDKPIRKHNFLSLWQHIMRKRIMAEKKKKETENVNVGTSSLHGVGINPAANPSLEIKKENEEEEEERRGPSEAVPVKEEEMIDPSDRYPGVPRQMMIRADRCQLRTGQIKRKMLTDQVRFKGRKRPVWNGELCRRFIHKLKKPSGGGSSSTSRMTVSERNLMQHLALSGFPQMNSLRVTQPAICERSVVHGTFSRGSAIHYLNPGCSKRPGNSDIGPSRTSSLSAYLGSLKLVQSRVRLITNLYPPNQPRNEARAPRNPVDSENGEVVNEVAEEESASSDEMEDGCTVEELFPELTNEDAEDEKSSTGNDGME